MTVLIEKQTRRKYKHLRRARPVQPEPRKVEQFEYGWREIPRVTDAGEVVYERQALTLWDILHPQVGDFRVHTIEHETFCSYLLDVFRAQVAHIPGTIVLHDTRVAWANRDIIPHGPDIAVIFNVREKDNWATFDELFENTKPSLVVEIVSPKTRRVDVEDKKDEYAQVGVPTYVIVDAKISRGITHYSLLGYTLVDGAYQPMKPNQQGWLWLECVKVWLGIEDNWLVCFDRDGNPIGDYVEVAEQAKRAEKLAKTAEARAEAETQRAEAETQRAELAIQRAESEAQRAETETQRAEAEAQARIKLEKQLQEMQAELEKLRKQQKNQD